MLPLKGLILKPKGRPYVPLKDRVRDISNSPPFKRSPCFYVTMTLILNVFNILTLKQAFLKIKKIGVLFFSLEYFE